MRVEPYSAGLVQKNPFVKRRKTLGEIVAVMDLKLLTRRLILIEPQSRALKRGEIHELILTDEERAKPGTEVSRVAYLCMFEVKEGGVVVVGDSVVSRGVVLGHVVGFDETHAPNHINIVLRNDRFLTGAELGLDVGDPIEIVPQ
jgi:hypothetical protein